MQPFNPIWALPGECHLLIMACTLEELWELEITEGVPRTVSAQSVLTLFILRPYSFIFWEWMKLSHCRLLFGGQFAPSVCIPNIRNIYTYLYITFSIILITNDHKLGNVTLEMYSLPGGQGSEIKLSAGPWSCQGPQETFVPCLFQFLVAVSIPGPVVTLHWSLSHLEPLSISLSSHL